MSKRVLIVDDSSLIRSVAQRAVVKNGYIPFTAINGKEGLEKLESIEIDIVFCDINMPIMDGLEMVKHVKANPKLKLIPIVMLTTESNPELKNRGRELGVKAWLLKPFNENKFLLALQKLVG